MNVLAQEEGITQNKLSVLQIMESAIMPATNTLWDIYAPETDEQWQELREAAVATIDAAGLLEAMSDDPAAIATTAPEFQAFNKIMREAANDALLAIDQRDVLALQKATEELYPPCENCHLKFNPGVIDQQ